MATNRLPIAGQDRNNWGTILNNYLRVSHDAKGSINSWADSSSRPGNPDDGVTGVNLQKGLFEQWNSTTSTWVEITKDTTTTGGSTTVTGGNILTADSVAALKTINTTNVADRTIVHLLGYYSPSDGGEGVLYLNKTSSEAANDGTVFQPTTGSGRWFRKITDSTVSVKQFGAKGDSTTDDTNRIQATINYANSSSEKRVLINSLDTGQFFKITNTLNLPNNVNIQGYGQDSAIRMVVTVASDGEPSVIKINGSNIKIEAVRLMGGNTAPEYSDASYNYADTKNCGIYANDTATITNITIKDCIIHNFYRNGINIKAKSDIQILNNFIYANNGYTGDIGVNGGFGGAGFNNRIVIDGNFCLSNSYNAGISASQLTAQDVLITNNVIITLNSSGSLLLTSTKPLRRHGIMVQYATGAFNDANSEQRMIVSNNLIRNTSWTGIYCNDTPVVNNVYYLQGCGPYVMTNNLITDVGINGLESSFDDGLSAGICMVGLGDGDVISNNIIVRVGNSANKIPALKVTQSGGGNKKSKFTDNAIKDCYQGFSTFNGPHNLDVSNNMFINSIDKDISYAMTGNYNVKPRTSFKNNTIFRNNSNAAAIQISCQTTTVDPVIVESNVLYGSSSTDTNANNKAIICSTSNVILKNNFISNFYKGIVIVSFTGDPKSYLPIVESNILEYIGSNGIEVGGTGTLLLESNIFKFDVVTPYSGSAVVGRRIYKNVEIFASSVPTTGNWVRGDRVLNNLPAIGQPNSWVCTASGNPGTWRSLGNVA